MWPDVLEYVKSQRMATFFRCQDARVLSLQDGVLALGFPSPGNLKAFATADHRALVEHALVQVIGVRARIEPVPAPGGGGQRPTQHAGPAAGAWAPPAHEDASASAHVGVPAATHDISGGPTAAAVPTRAEAASAATRSSEPPADWSAAPEAQPWQPPEPPAPEEGPSRQAQPGSASRTNGAARVRQAMDRGAEDNGPREGRADQAGSDEGDGDARFRRGTIAPEDDVADPDDPDAEDSGLVGAPVVEQILGGKVITIEESDR